MNEEQQNIVIAKLMGAKWVKSFNRQTPNKAVLVFVKRLSLDYGDEIVYVNESDENFTKVVHAHVPDYCNDLNAMHEAENHLKPDEKEIYWNYLFDHCDGTVFSRVEDDYKMIHATAAQRAEAFLKTLKLWKEQ